MSDDAEKRATIFFQTGDKALGRKDYDYAVECFANCAKLVPTKLIYRQALRAAQRKKHNDNGKGVAMAAMRMGPAKMKMSLAKRQGKWKDVVDAAEEALALNPWDSSLLFEQGQALQELGLIDVAIFVVETARDNKTADIYRKLAELYEQSEQFDKAIKTWESVSKLDPADEQALSKMRQLAASATIQKGRFDAEDEGSGRENSARMAAPETFEVRMEREIAEILAKIEAEPGSVPLYKDLGEHYRRLGHLEKAAEAYAKGLEASGGADLDLQIRVKESQIEPYRKKLSEAEGKRSSVDLKRDPENAHKLANFIKACTAEICKREAEIFRLKLQMNAEDFGAHYELGYRHLRLGELDEAIKSLQKGRNDLQNRWRAMLYLGVAFWRKKNFPLAEKNLSDAIDAVGSVNEEGRKEILYYRGRVAQDMGDLPRALSHFNDIAAIDYEYKDVARRIDEITAAS